MLSRLRARAGAFARATGYGVSAGREVDVFPDDSFLVSYPRSGNTWCLFLLVGLRLGSEDASFESVTALDIYENSNRTMRRLPRPRILKSHEPFDGRYGRVVYLVRDPRDVAPSYYRYLRVMSGMDVGYDAFLERFLFGGLDRYGTWGAHVDGWLPRRGDEDFLLVRYEELRQAPEAQLTAVADFFGLETTPDLVAGSVAGASRQALHERHQRDESGRWSSRLEAMRSLEFGGRRPTEELDDETLERSRARIADVWAEQLEALGYG